MTMTGRMLAYAALWANGAPRVLCAEIMGVTEQTVIEARKRLQRKYAAEGVTIRNGADMARVLDAELPTIVRHRPSTALLPEPGRRGGRPSTITPERLAAVLQLQAEGVSLTRIAAELGVGRGAISRALRRAEQQP